ncbi:MAG TPA: TRAP transporter substrate-binding protein [Hyphomicrobiales bacterium]|nr:TRAP transporter substrate-binding protein [Hyphomicrobiales bacterium]
MKTGKFAALALAAATLFGAGAALAQDKPIHLRISHWVPPTHPLQPALEEWAARVKKESNGTITSTIYPSQQLGKAFDHYDMARDGVADMTYVSPGYQPGRFPIIAGAALPFLFSNASGGTAALDEWYRKYAAKEMSDVHFCLAFVHDPGALFTRDKKVLLPSDMKGMKIRPATGTIAALVTNLGGTNVQASAPEAREVLARGVADGITFPWGSIVLFGIDKVVKYAMELPLYTTPFVMVMHKQTYDAMSPTQKKAIDDNCNTEAAVRLAAPWGKFEHDGIAKISAEPNHVVYKLNAEQTAAWVKAAEPLTARWEAEAKKAGLADPAAALNDLKADLKKNDALLKVE